ncbi:chorismate-binding protein, partial [bacterium]|nr:chorismate-binding protein [bacterium]
MLNDLADNENFVFLETIKTDTDNFKSFLFLEPVNVLQTSRIDEIETVLKETEEYVDKGFYAAGYIAYEAGYAFEQKLKNLIPKRNPSCPLIWFGIFKKPSIFDLRGDNSVEIDHTLSPGESSYKINDINFNMEQDDYKNKIEQIKKYIHSGDTYQINFTWNIHFSFEGSTLAFYDDLRRKQSVSYSAFIKSGDTSILSFSPELFFRRKGDTIITRPMKGTMKRGRTLSEDEENIKALKNSEKNRAENLMIVDLVRNDLGRV